MCLRFSDWPISIHNWVYIFHRVLSDPYPGVLFSEECQTKKLLVCCKMFAFSKPFLTKDALVLSGFKLTYDTLCPVCKLDFGTLYNFAASNNGKSVMPGLRCGSSFGLSRLLYISLF